MTISGFAGSSGSAGPTGPTGPRGARTALGAALTGPSGATGLQGTASAFTPPSREVVFPNKEGKAVARFALVDDVIEIRAKAASTVSLGIRISLTIVMVLLRDGKETVVQSWSDSEAYRKEPEELVTWCLPIFQALEVTPPSHEELTAMFVMTKKAMMKMMAVVCSELLISHVGREDMDEAWADANALRVMTE